MTRNHCALEEVYNSIETHLLITVFVIVIVKIAFPAPNTSR
jgi:hypothetical protein